MMSTLFREWPWPMQAAEETANSTAVLKEAGYSDQIAELKIDEEP
jgi:hypothetical protein